MSKLLEPGADPSLRARLLDDLRVAGERAVAWVVARLDGSGGPRYGGHQAYRLPWALALAGAPDHAARALSWLEGSVLTSKGDLAEGPMQDSFRHLWASYPLACMASGAWHLERYDTAGRLVRRLAVYQHPTLGGAYAERPEVRRSGRQDLFPTAQLGLTALLTGETEMAERAHRWMARLYEQQAYLPDLLYTATDDTGTLLDPPDDDPDLRWQVLTDLRAPRQAFYNPGIAAAFLARYHTRNGDPAALDLARRFFSLSTRATPRQFDYTESVQVCKLGWGAAVLLEADPTPEHLEWTMRMGEWFLAAQQPDGRWQESPFRRGDGDAKDLAVTAEFLQHVCTIRSALGGRDPALRDGVG